MIHDFCDFVLSITFYMIRESEIVVKCSKKYSRIFQEKIIMKKNDYLIYRRRNDDCTWITRLLNDDVFTFDNRWMMFYNFFLTRRYQTHVNVKICASVKVVKYIHKYIYKEDNQITLQINENDEIAKHVNDRYINSSQVAWKLLEYSSHQEWSSIHHLFVHLFKQ